MFRPQWVNSALHVSTTVSHSALHVSTTVGYSALQVSTTVGHSALHVSTTVGYSALQVSTTLGHSALQVSSTMGQFSTTSFEHNGSIQHYQFRTQWVVVFETCSAEYYIIKNKEIVALTVK
jgi:hypothetical protein